MGHLGASRKSPNKRGSPTELPSLWGTRVQAESLLIKEAHSQELPSLWGTRVQAESLLIKEAHSQELPSPSSCNELPSQKFLPGKL